MLSAENVFFIQDILLLLRLCNPGWPQPRPPAQFVPCTVGLRLRQKMDCCLRILFMGFIPKNTMAVTTVYIPLVLRNEHMVTVLRNSFSLFSVSCFAREVENFINVTYSFIISLYSPDVFLGSTDFYCVKLKSLSQYYSLK